jgi:FixJ family two-component response regulator
MRTPGGASGADVHSWIVLHRPELKDRMLFITGDTVNENTMQALQSTGVPYIEKPFRVQELINIVERIFGKAE